MITLRSSGSQTDLPETWKSCDDVLTSILDHEWAAADRLAAETIPSLVLPLPLQAHAALESHPPRHYHAFGHAYPRECGTLMALSVRVPHSSSQNRIIGEKPEPQCSGAL